jgi:2-oxoisovalerate dehydrogenase E1 component
VLIVQEDTLTAGFGAEIAATVARAAFWDLDAPVDRLAVEDVPMPYHENLLSAVLPSAATIAERIEALLSV